MCEEIVQTIILGQYNCLEVNREKEHGLYLVSGDGSELLMPRRYVTETMQIGTKVNAFVYTDSEDRMVATTETPLARVGEFAYLECVDVTPFGAFIYWGISKDLLVPRSAMGTTMEKGQKYLVRISFDNETHRLVGVSKSKPFIVSALNQLTKFGKYPAIVEEQTPMGYKVIVAQKYQGMLFSDEIFTPISVGDTIEVYIKNIRADGKTDCTLQAIGKEAFSTADETIMKLLKEKKQLPYNSKSDAQQIQDVFGLSKKSFKAALQRLKTAEKLEIRDEGIFLV